MIVRRMVIPAVGVLALAVSTGHAMAQANECEQGAKLLQSRQAIIGQINSFKNKRPTAAQACSAFSMLASNNQRLVSWLEGNAAWCNIPEQAVASVKSQVGQIATARNRACEAAAQTKKMEAIAKQRAAQGGGPPSPFTAGDDVTGGPRNLPRGAL